MAPSNVSRDEKEKRLRSIISIAEELCSFLSVPLRTKAPKSFIDELEKNIHAFPKNSTVFARQGAKELDAAGTTLWNLCTRLRRNDVPDEAQPERNELLLARVYAFLLLNCAQNSDKGSMANAVRVMKVSLKTARDCIQRKHYDLALRVLEKAADYEDRLTKPREHITQEDIDTTARLSAEYFVLRIMLEWRLDHLSVMEHMYKKVVINEQYLDPGTAESLADVLFEIGKEQLGKQQYELAVKWLERAYDMLTSQDLDKLSYDANELRTSIIQASVASLLKLERHDAYEKAQSLVTLLESEVGDKLVVLLLKFDLLLSSTAEAFDNEAYSMVLHTIIVSVALNDSTFKLIMHHIRKLHDKSPSLACQRLDEFLRIRVLESEKDEWVETTIVNRIWMATRQRDGPDLHASIKESLNTVLLNHRKPIGSSATHAAHTLLWKRIEANYGQGQYDIAEQWCRLAVHQLFEQTGELNSAKFARKLLLCALARHDWGGAREVFNTMTEGARNDPQTRFLMYKVAIRSNEIDTAEACLDFIYSAKDPNLLYACVLDAQQVGDKVVIMKALERVLKKHEYSAPPNCHLPALLRLTIRLATSLIEHSSTLADTGSNIYMEQLCKLYEGASNQARRVHDSEGSTNRIFTALEIEWFSKSSYNLAVKNCADWESSIVIRLLQSCITFIELYLHDADEQKIEDISLRRLFCDYLAAILLVAEARVQENIELQLQNYLKVRRHVDSYDKILQEKLQLLSGEPARDLLKKLSTLISYDFEAAVQLKAWNDLTEIVLKADLCKDMKVYEIMADCMLSSDIPTNVLIPTLKRVVNATWSLDEYDITKLSRYMRCLFQFALAHTGPAAEDLLDSIISQARSASETDMPYPTEELEWIATTAFNRGIDFYCAGQDTECNAWASKAITIASFCPDNGALQHTLNEKFMSLRWKS